MKTATTKPTSLWYSARRDMRHDWDGWSVWERRAVTALGVTSTAAGLFWLAMSAWMLS